MVHDKHELNDTPLWQVLPVLKPILSLCGKVREPKTDDEENKEHGSSHKKKFQVPEGEDKTDRLNELGFGIVAYKDLMFNMFALFAVMSMIIVPAMYYYGEQDAMTITSNYLGYSLGNFGYSDTVCQTTPFSLKQTVMKCNYGYVANVESAGVISDSMPEKNICNTNVILEDQCTKLLRTDLVTLLNGTADAPQSRNRTYTFSQITDIFAQN